MNHKGIATMAVGRTTVWVPGTYYSGHRMTVEFATVKGSSYQYYHHKAATATARRMLATATEHKPKDAAITIAMTLLLRDRKQEARILAGPQACY